MSNINIMLPIIIIMSISLFRNPIHIRILILEQFVTVSQCNKNNIINTNELHYRTILSLRVKFLRLCEIFLNHYIWFVNSSVLLSRTPPISLLLPCVIYYGFHSRLLFIIGRISTTGSHYIKLSMCKTGFWSVLVGTIRPYSVIDLDFSYTYSIVMFIV